MHKFNQTLVFRLLFSTFLLCGCGDPTTGRLEAGSSVLLVPHLPDYQKDQKPSSFVILDSLRSEDYEPVDVGAEAIVIADEGDASSDSRKVTIRLKTGDDAGKSGNVYRNNLRPVK
jgi:hypothetical protein